ncbi:hypothetical protein M0657_006708 [Pyricularia oryzae]|uniref:Uncharacterized protein n=1 Tax=Pyricularia oryzae TaxID=318829 RepID=A0A4V1C871_PYROR|nr:hypothetical protein M0657_006708 [Pyricularia oryzae]KAI7922974.1 hypothetical protein M9X92_004635 [Pyricularia oryzae]QBZ65868.1 hypothetical protein PoMZ_12835 [Pyricularia oryzae]
MHSPRAKRPVSGEGRKKHIVRAIDLRPKGRKVVGGGQAASGVVCLSSNTGRPFLQTEAAYFWGQFPLRTTAGGKVE